MAYIQAEFHSDEEDQMWEVFSYLEDLLGPRAPKPPMKNTSGKWHFYMESPDHKLKTKQCRRDTRQY